MQSPNRALCDSLHHWEEQVKNTATDASAAANGELVSSPPTGTSNSDDTSTAPVATRVEPRIEDFSERSWWMVDLRKLHQIRQGATDLVWRCMRTHGWDLDKSYKILEAYRQFLVLKKVLGDWNATLLSPSRLVDQMWRCHILDVTNYYHDSILLCGRLVGHNPDEGLDTEAMRARLERTRRELKTRFREKYDEELWIDPGDRRHCQNDNHSSPNRQPTRSTTYTTSTRSDPCSRYRMRSSKRRRSQTNYYTCS